MRGRYLEYFISEQILFFLKQFAKKNKWLALLQPPKVASTLASGPASVRECRVTAQLTNNIAKAKEGKDQSIFWAQLGDSLQSTTSLSSLHQTHARRLIHAWLEPTTRYQLHHRHVESTLQTSTWCTRHS
jgi:hypothetical protein